MVSQPWVRVRIVHTNNNKLTVSNILATFCVKYYTIWNNITFLHLNLSHHQYQDECDMNFWVEISLI
jgi:hypothetical protein